MAKDRKRFFTQGQIEQVSKVLAECLTGSEIGHLLISVGIADVDPNNTKWKRLFNAFVEENNRLKSDNYLLNFIARALEPSRFVGKSTQYGTIIDELNVVLSFQGLMFLDDGKFHTVKSAETLSEAEKRVSSLKRAITERNLHPELMKYCRTELVQDNYFHAVLEAVKGISSDIRNRTGPTSDGAELVDSAFAGTNPLLRINRLVSDTEKSEQKGFINLLKGLLGTFRNPTAHAAKIEWKMDELDALDLFTMASYAYRRIGSAVDRP